MTEINFDGEENDLKLSPEPTPQVEVSTVRQRGEFDNVELSESSSKSEDDDGEDIGSGSSADDKDRAEDEESSMSRKRRFEDDDGDDDDDESGDKDGENLEGDEEEKKAKRQKRAAVRREVVGDEIEMCFIPLGIAPNTPLTLIGVTLCVVRVVNEGKIFRVLQQAFQQPDDVARREEERKIDYYEDQFKPDAPVPRHYCQPTRSERYVAHLSPADKRNVFSSALESVREEARSPKRVYVYCTVTFPTAELFRAFQSPFLNYPLKGKLLTSCFTTTNWQSATDWPTNAMDISNADANAALITEANMCRSTNQSVPNNCCTARQPLSINSLLSVQFVSITNFGGDRSATPILYKSSFSQRPKISADSDYASVDHTLTVSRFASIIGRSSFCLDESCSARPEHHRRPGAVRSVCEACCSADATSRLVLTRKAQVKSLRAVKKAALRFFPGVRQMTLDNAVELLREYYLPAGLAQSTKYTVVANLVLPPLAPSNFWNAVDAVGFDVSVSLVRTKMLNVFCRLLMSDAPHQVLTAKEFDTYKLHENATFVNKLSERLHVAHGVIKQFAFVRSLVDKYLVNADSEQRTFSRPDLLDDLMQITWPRVKHIPFAVFALDAGGSSTKFVSTRSFVMQEMVVFACLQHSFSRVYPYRSDDAETLRNLMANRVFDDPVIVVVTTPQEYANWKVKSDESRQKVLFLNLYEEKSLERLLDTIQPPDSDNDDAAWNVCIPRSDKISYGILCAVLGALCTKKIGASEPWANWATSLLSASDSPEYLATKEVFSKGVCRNGRLFLGGLAFQLPCSTRRGGSLLDDLYFSGVYEHFLTEKYVLVPRLQQVALQFEQSNDPIVVKQRLGADDDDAASIRLTLAPHELMFSHRVGMRKKPGLETILEINAATVSDSVVLFATPVACGKIMHTVFDRVAFTKKNFLPSVVANVGEKSIALIFDSVSDDEFFAEDASKPPEFRASAYNFGNAPKDLPATTIDRFSACHRDLKLNVRSGFSIASMIALYEHAPRSVIVFGSREQSVDSRVVSQTLAPWYYAPPTKNSIGRPWYHNSEATELSLLCWLICALKR